MKKPQNKPSHDANLRAHSKAPRKEPLPYLSHRPSWRGRLLRLRHLLAA